MKNKITTKWHFLFAAVAFLTLAVKADAQCTDAFEPNDSFATASPITAGLTTNLTVTAGNHDYYEIAVPTDHEVRVGWSGFGVGSINAALFSAPNPGSLIQAVDPSHSSYIEAVNFTGGPTFFYFRVTTGYGTCGTYSLDISTNLVPCLSQNPQDGFEDNDDCVSAAPITPGHYANLHCSATDSDFYEIEIPPHHELSVSFLHQNFQAHLRTLLYVDSACNSVVDSASTIFGFGLTVDWQNQTDQPITAVLKVLVDPLLDEGHWYPGVCSGYYLDITLTNLSPPAPTFCYGDGSGIACPCTNESAPGSEAGCANSQGHGATLTASGQMVVEVVNDDLQFTIAGARPGQASMLVQGGSLIAMPFKDGVFCLGYPTTRVEVVMLDAAGQGTTQGQISTLGAVNPGDTRYYQQWYRDPNLSVCGTGSNFTQGVEIIWI